MSSEPGKPTGPNLRQGIGFGELPDGGLLAGHADGEAVLLARQGDEIFAVGAVCTHYSGPLAEGLLVGDTVRCPWHHACFSLRTGEAIRAPALDPVARWRIEVSGDRIFVREKLPTASLAPPAIKGTPGPGSNFVIVGGGAAGFAAAERLRREG